MRELTLDKTRLAEFKNASSSAGTFWAAALFPCVAGAAVCMLSGLAISGLSALGLISLSRFGAYSTVTLLFGAFVLMFLGAHCMDRRDAAERSERLERSRGRGYKEKG